MCYNIKKGGVEMEHTFWIGSVYKFMGAEGDIIVKFLEDNEEAYKVIIKKGTGEFARYNNSERMLFKTSKILTTYHWTRLADEEPDFASNDPVMQDRKKRRTRDEVEVDNLIEHVQRKIKMEQLMVAIDKALEHGHTEVFVRLAKEYTKLKAKVIA
jgi:hypothetical protein